MSRTVFGACAPLLAILIVAAPAAAQSTADQVATDWDLHMLRLVNRARTDPAGEDVRQGTSYNETAVAPLGYDLQVGRAAQNHNEWMGLNRNNPAINNPWNDPPLPESFTHCETLDGQWDGPPATGTPGYSGVLSSDRLEYVGFDWWACGENILWRSNTPTINAALIESNHAEWWTSDGHRENMVDGDFALFGHHAANDDDHWATQNFALLNSAEGPQTNILGLLYRDRDTSSDWTPQAADEPLREGLGGIAFSVLPAAGGPEVASGVTLDNGGYCVGVEDGTYDLLFTDLRLPGGSIRLEDIAVSGVNVDAGDTQVVLPTVAGDANADDAVDAIDASLLQAAWGARPGDAHYNRDADFNGDGRTNLHDAFILNQNWGHTGGRSPAPAPEPATGSLLLAGLLAVLRQRRRKRA
jgi:hypothetical protein